MRWSSWLFLIALLSCTLAGCAAEYERPALEDMAMIGVMGFDYVDDTQMKVLVSIPVPAKGKETTQIYATQASMTSEAMLALAPKVERTITLSQLRVILFSEELARKSGIGKVVLDLYRNPIVGENVFIAIVKGKVEDVIRGKYKNKPEINTYLNDLLRPRVETAFSSFSTIHDFVFMMTSNIGDPNLPYLVKQDGSIEIAQVALLRKDKMIGLYSQREGKLVQCLLGRKRLPRVKFGFGDPDAAEANADMEEIIFDFVWSKSKVRSNGNTKKPVIHIDLELRGVVVGYDGKKNLDKRPQITKLVKQMEKRIQSETKTMLKNYQKWGVDPAGLEESLRQKYHGKWTREKGLALYKKADLNIKVKLDILGYGTIK
ncbi:MULTISPECIES: Ger(x)C family spore germination protein [Brevibacillus]|jgi:germination protein, Ger(x)C family|uniref:Ger(x)C family spore germination protein n=1 Tax=Brevibacillus TaxID=55080 RepID=UPI00156AE034|nr:MULTISPECIES: Ger(x)C family spore germination protein [Brevibacillus]MED2255584.1 Ger(x)C family spore germination protein [Brevibacillus parabrevis]UED68186.1 Ger(x)C family spore germination protein [Brevibacillus sp. HD3.3A]